MDIEIKSLLEDFCKLCGERTSTSFVEHFALPITVVRPSDTHIYRSHEAFSADLRATFAPLWESGLSEVKHTVLAQHKLGPVIVSLDIQWQYLDASSRVLRLDYVTYVLRRWPNRFEVVSYVDHSQNRWVSAHAG